MDNLAKLQTAVPLIEQLERHGHRAFIVGGAVRNHLLNIPINDVDIATSATPEEVEHIFSRTIPVGKEHGTMMVLYEGDSYEVTTFRVEGSYDDYRRPDNVFFVTELKDDLLRRDFTINAMALDRQFQVVDYVGGQQDLQNKYIRAVGNAYDRFSEDALRMLRACRFQSALDFAIEPQTKQAMVTHSALMRHVSIERIIVEVKKLLAGLNPASAMTTMEHTYLYQSIPVFSQMKQLYKPVRAVTFESYMGYCLYKDMIACHDISQLKLSNHEVKRIKAARAIYTELSENHPLPLTVYHYGTLTGDCLNMLAALGEQVNVTVDDVNAILVQLPIKERSDMMIDGHDLMTHLNRRGGSWLKEILLEIEELIVLGRLPNCQKDILKWVDNHVKI